MACGANPKEVVGAPKVVVVAEGNAVLKMLLLPPEDPNEEEDAKLFAPEKLKFNAGAACDPLLALLMLLLMPPMDGIEKLLLLGILKAVEDANNGATGAEEAGTEKGTGAEILEAAAGGGAANVLVVVFGAAVNALFVPKAGKDEKEVVALLLLLLLSVVVVGAAAELDGWKRVDPDPDPEDLELSALVFSEGDSGMKFSLVTSTPYLATRAS